MLILKFIGILFRTVIIIAVTGQNDHGRFVKILRILSVQYYIKFTIKSVTLLIVKNHSSSEFLND